MINILATLLERVKPTGSTYACEVLRERANTMVTFLAAVVLQQSAT